MQIPKLRKSCLWILLIFRTHLWNKFYTFFSDSIYCLVSFLISWFVSICLLNYATWPFNDHPFHSKVLPTAWPVVNNVFFFLPARTWGQPEEHNGGVLPVSGLCSSSGLAQLPDSKFVLLAEFMKIQAKLRDPHPFPSQQCWNSLGLFQDMEISSSSWCNSRTSARKVDEKNFETSKCLQAVWTTLGFSKFHVVSKNTSLNAPWRRRSCCRRFISEDFCIPDDRQTNVQRGDTSFKQPPGDKMHPLAIPPPLVEFLLAPANTPHKEPVPPLTPSVQL